MASSFPGEPNVDAALARSHKLSAAEWETAQTRLGRLPTYAELGAPQVTDRGPGTRTGAEPGIRLRVSEARHGQAARAASRPSLVPVDSNRENKPAFKLGHLRST